MNSDIYIVIKEYDEKLAKRQPWYSIKKLKLDLEKQKKRVVIVPSIMKVPEEFTGTIIKVFGLSDLWKKNMGNYKLIYLMTFPIYNIGKFLTFDIKTTIENWKGLDRVFVMSLVPKFILKNTLKKADEIIVISDRSEKFLSQSLEVLKYIPFIDNNWDGVKKNKDLKEIKTIGYFGPPYITRSFDEVINFFIWLQKNNYKLNKKIITRIEREELKGIEKKYISRIYDKSLKVVSGFLDRKSLAEELLEIDVLILPFKIVMSELPIVVLEALELNIPIVTTEDSGIKFLTDDMSNVLMLDKFSKKHYQEVVDFVHQSKPDGFEKIQKRINDSNQIALEHICQN